jgi:hypothetical protein
MLLAMKEAGLKPDEARSAKPKEDKEMNEARKQKQKWMWVKMEDLANHRC